MKSFRCLPSLRNLRTQATGLAAALTLVAAFMALGGAAAAQATSGPPASRYAQAATGYQNTVIRAALADNPSGVRVAPNKVEWNAGTEREVIMIVPASPDEPAIPNNCPYSITEHWTCVYSRINFKGTQLQFKDCCYAQNLYAYGGKKWHTNSWVNNRHQKAYLWQYKSKPHGASFCMSPVATGANSSGTSFSHDQWIYLVHSGSCP
jgi:hypothetical protein